MTLDSLKSLHYKITWKAMQVLCSVFCETQPEQKNYINKKDANSYCTYLTRPFAADFRF